MATVALFDLETTSSHRPSISWNVCMIDNIIPVLRVTSSREAERFYCDQLGFELRFAYRVDESMDDPCYMGLTANGTWLHVSSFPGDGVVGGVAYLRVDDVDAIFATLVENGVAVDLEPTDQSWGNREVYVKDPDGNTLRYAQESV